LPEAVPFSDEAAARRFAADNGGRVVRLADTPESYILEGGA
jgi:copper chaperone NosL